MPNRLSAGMTAGRSIEVAAREPKIFQQSNWSIYLEVTMILQSSTTLVDASAAPPVDEIEALLGYREQEEVDAALTSGEPSTTILSSGPNPQAIAVAARVSPRAFDLIVNYETGGRPYYERILKARP